MLFFVSADSVLPLLLNAPVSLPLRLHRIRAVSWGRTNIPVMRDVGVKCFQVYLVVFEGFDVAVQFPFDGVVGDVVEKFGVNEVCRVELEV